MTVCYASPCCSQRLCVHHLQTLLVQQASKSAYADGVFCMCSCHCICHPMRIKRLWKQVLRHKDYDLEIITKESLHGAASPGLVR